MKLGALVPHLGIYGGIRRYLEMGNVFTSMQNEFTLYVAKQTDLKWFNFIGKIKPLSEARNEQIDAIFCGDVGLLTQTKYVNAKLKIIQTIGCRGVEKYKNFYEDVRGREDFLFVGVSKNWNESFNFENPITISGGVNINLFKPIERKKKNETFDILTLGRVNKKVKCVRNIIEAVKWLRKKDVRLILYDSEPIKLGFSGIGVNVVKEVGITQERLVELYNIADIYVSAEIGAGWSNPCAEAMACRTAVICTMFGTKDFAIDNETALVLKKATPDEIANKIEVLYNDANLREKLASAGFSVIQNFSWGIVCKKFYELICEKLGMRK